MNGVSLLRFATISGMLAVILGAFAAHALRDRIDIPSLEIWKTANFYQFIHTGSLLVVALLMLKYKIKLLRLSAIFFILGIVFFSGSLYLLSVKSLISFDVLWLGPITPIGGLCFITGWVCLFIAGGKIRINS